MKLPAAIQKNVHWYFYPVGHMLYFNPEVLPRVDHDIDAFIENASAHG